MSLKVLSVEFKFKVRFLNKNTDGSKPSAKSKCLIIASKWVPNVKFNFHVWKKKKNFHVWVDSRQCLTDTSKLNSTLGTFSDICLWSYLSVSVCDHKLLYGTLSERHLPQYNQSLPAALKRLSALWAANTKLQGLESLLNHSLLSLFVILASTSQY